MHTSLAIVASFLIGSIAVQAAPIQGGSWCFNPKSEPFWGAATAKCCKGWMGEDRRCHDIPDCKGFYNCCINDWKSGNHLTDTCT
ncbi:hypothetical protein B0O80DRAFT_440799 [Mortierella sp. GBAus27b]|nr:hypothetical protein B0O80DRAFT_440799 [Mortierella sp. GBAus27b]